MTVFVFIDRPHIPCLSQILILPKSRGSHIFAESRYQRAGGCPHRWSIVFNVYIGPHTWCTVTPIWLASRKDVQTLIIPRMGTFQSLKRIIVLSLSLDRFLPLSLRKFSACLTPRTDCSAPESKHAPWNTLFLCIWFFRDALSFHTFNSYMHITVIEVSPRENCQ